MWWHILEVEQNDDIKTVKRAYAKILRTLDQDQDIDEFTKINQAYRLAMKDLSQRKDQSKKTTDYQKDVSAYMDELESLYNNEEKRYSTTAWKYLFACFSFREEEHLKVEYVSFFNHHHYLTEEIWQFVEGYYPLISRKEFKWKELLNGNYSIKEDELKGLTAQESITYVKTKIQCFYALLNKDYIKSQELIDQFLSNFESDECIVRWQGVLQNNVAQLDIHSFKDINSKRKNYLSKGAYQKLEKASKPFAWSRKFGGRN